MMSESPLENVDPQFRKILKVLNGPAYTPPRKAEKLNMGPGIACTKALAPAEKARY